MASGYELHEWITLYRAKQAEARRAIARLEAAGGTAPPFLYAVALDPNPDLLEALADQIVALREVIVQHADVIGADADALIAAWAHPPMLGGSSG